MADRWKKILKAALLNSIPLLEKKKTIEKRGALFPSYTTFLLMPVLLILWDLSRNGPETYKQLLVFIRTPQISPTKVNTTIANQASQNKLYVIEHSTYIKTHE